MKKPVVLGLVVLVLAAAAVLVWRTRGGGEKEKTRAMAADAGARPPSVQPPVGDDAPAPPPDLRLSYDDDPAGTMRLEGQVVDEDEHGVAGALVAISSNPPRTVKTEGDGSFVFEGLLARTYAVTAEHDDAAAGPVSVRVHAKVEALTLRLKQAATLELTVLDAGDKRPIAGALVERVAVARTSVTTDAEGRARLGGVGGWVAVKVSAPGYGPAHEAFQVTRKGGAVEKKTVTLSRGAAVSGTVVDGAGKPIAGARVLAENTARPWSLQNARDDGAVTDEKGRWKMAALGAGTYRFTATHEKHAPGVSSPVALDGTTEQQGVEIRLEAGARLAGRVVSATGEPVGFAAVRVALQENAFGWDVARQATCDERGAFDVSGLPRKKVNVIAIHESAVSSALPLDLQAVPEKTDLVITLDVAGEITGVVVTSSGAPVPEAQVSALPDLFGDSGAIEELRLRGVATDVTNMSGEFRLTGLKKAKYQVRAARAGGGMDDADFWLRPGVPAEPGATGLRIVLEEDGAVKGKVLFADGSAPELFSVAASAYGGAAPFTGTGGDFRLENVPPGRRMLVVTGPGFVRKMTDPVDVKPGAETDVGTITVERGRNLRGVVVRLDGTPVAGAKVHAGEYVSGDGANLGGEGFFGGGEGTRRTAETGSDGTFEVSGIGPQAAVVVADHAREGRSVVTSVPAGQTDVQLTLTLLQPGALEGTVTSGGAPLGDGIVSASPHDAGRTVFVVRTGPDGSYRFERLAPDVYNVTAMRSTGVAGGRLETKTATVQPGQTSRLDIDVRKGEVTLKVKVVGEGGADPGTVVLVLFEGTLQATNAAELQKEAERRGPGAIQQVMTMGGLGTLKDVTAGAYTLCALPLGDVTDPAVSARLQKEPESVPAQCAPRTIAASPADQELTLTVAPLAPRP